MTTEWMGKRSPEVGDAQELSDEEILRRLNSLGLEMSRERLDELTAKAVAAEDLANELYSAKTPNGRDLLWVWVLLEELWTRWFPQRLSREGMSELIDAGYEMEDAESVPYWLDLFDQMMRWLDRRGGSTADEVDELMGEDASFLGWIEDIGERLHAVCDRDEGMRVRCIGFCEEYLRRFEGEEPAVTEKVRQTMAELLSRGGERAKAEALYRQWLTADPQWGDGWMKYADLYYDTDAEKADMVRCEELLREGLAVDGVRDREELELKLREVRHELRHPEMEADDNTEASVKTLSDGELMEQLAADGVEMTREKLGEWTERVPAAREIAEALLEDDPDFDESRREGMVQRLSELWQRWYPERPSFEMLEGRIQEGYSLDQADAAAGWLKVFDDLVAWMDAHGVKGLAELEDLYPWTEFLFNWVQDVESSLLAACAKRPEMFPRAIAFCEEFLRRFGGEEDLIRENFRRTMGELIFESGDAGKAEALFGEWLAEDPQWGWGWIGRSDLYRFTRTPLADLSRSERILREALAVPGVRDRKDIVERLRDCLLDQGRVGEAQELEVNRQPRKAVPAYVPVLAPVRVVKVGRNDPCPCGSGKKYKKCCLGK